MSGSGFAQFIPLILIFVIFYFFLIRPQQRKIKDHKAMVASLKRGDQIVTSGGRVLNINGYGKNLVDAKEKAYSLVKKINWSGCYYRKDIGWRALKE